MRRLCGSCKYFTAKNEKGICHMAKMRVGAEQVCPAYDLDKEGLDLLKALENIRG
jgi:hypothetical protein